MLIGTAEYTRYIYKTQEETQKEDFIRMIDSMKKVSQNHLNSERGYVKNWANYIFQNDMTMQEALEFLRFLATKDEINKMAEVKGIPSVAVDGTNADIYKDVLNPGKTEMNYVNDGSITTVMESGWYTCVNKYITGEFSSSKEALQYYVKLCSKK